MKRAAGILLATFSVAAILTWVIVAACRLGHPFELEWQEGGMLQHVERLLAGEALYTAPSLEFVPFPYPPLYPVLGALLSPVLGVGFTALRLISIVATLATLLFLTRLASLQSSPTSGHVPGLVAAGLYAVCFPFAGAWFDLARVDSLFLALALAGATTLRAARAPRAHALAGALLFLATCAKQTALPLALLLALPAFQRGRRCARAYLIALLVPGALAFCVGHALTDGWSTRHLFLLPAAHPFQTDLAIAFWTEDLFGHLAIALGLTAAVLLERPTNGEARDLFPPALILGLLGTSWFSRAHVGGWDNVLMPACAALALGSAVAVDRIGSRWKGGGLGTPSGRIAALLSLLVIGQFLLLSRDPRPQVPTAEARTAGESFVESLRQDGGVVLVPYHGYLAARAGSPSGAHAMGLIDLMRGGDPEAAGPLLRELEASLARRRWSAIYLDEPWDLPALDEHYRLDPLYEAPEDLKPVTGEPTLPRHRYLPR
jgi:hypothetical protein